MAGAGAKSFPDVDLVSGLPLPHLSFMMRHFLPMAFSRSDKGSDIQKAAVEKFRVEKAEIIVSGSSREGISLPALWTLNKQGGFVKFELADVDIMMVGIRKLVGEPQDDPEYKFGYFIHNKNVHPGYTLLRIANPETTSETLRGQIQGSDDWFLSASNSTNIISDGFQKDPGDVVQVQGPAVNYNSESDQSVLLGKYKVRGDADIVHGLKVPKWPSVAQEWVHRKRRSNWPSREMIQEVVSKGCNLVGTGHVNSTHRDLEWRFSFSMAEMMLIQNLTTTQKQCYLLFKTLHSRFFKEPKGVATYHLKTTLLWAAEEVPVGEWREENVGPMVLFLLDTLLNFIVRGCIPSYFIPSNNLIDALPKETIQVIKRKVMDVRKNPMEKLLIFNDTTKYYFGPLFTDMRTLYQSVLKDCCQPKPLSESLHSAIVPAGFLVAFAHLAEHRTLKQGAGITGSIPDYSLPFDIAIDVVGDLSRMVAETIRYHFHPAEAIMRVIGMLDDKQVVALLCQRILERFPNAPNRDKLMELGAEYHPAGSN